MNVLSGAIKEADNCWRIVPHGRLHDKYQRGEYLCPGLLSYAAAVLKPDGGFRVEVREHIEEFGNQGERVWICRSNWRDLTSSYLIVRDPVPWVDIPWLIRECEMTVLAWLRAQNDPDAWNIPGLRQWLLYRDNDHIRRVGRLEYTKQYRKFWNRDLPRDISIWPMADHEIDRFGSEQDFHDFVYGAD